MANSFELELRVDGDRYRVRFEKRPFREGCEVVVYDATSGDKLFSVGELGLGTEATLERVRLEIQKLRQSRS